MYKFACSECPVHVQGDYLAPPIPGGGGGGGGVVGHAIDRCIMHL